VATRGEKARRSARRIAVIGGACGGLLVFALAAIVLRERRVPTDVSRASWAVGLSAGAGLRGALEPAPEALRRGLVDGLAHGMATTPVMERRETYERVREVLQRLSDAELAAIAARVDEARDR